MTPDYGDFLFRDVLPFAEKELQFEASDRPDHRTVCGLSSGGIAAFNVAWQHPEKCQRVISHCGSFTDIWGGHNFPSLIRKTDHKPLRIFLQSGTNDANTPFGNWALANQTMASALSWASYDFRFEYGTGGHNLSHGGSIFADTLHWIWRDL
jgi:enterochelin esterase family protein